MDVSRDDLERSLATLAGEIDDPLSGIHGAHTVAWRLAREASNFIGSGRAALLQLAHPPVASAIAEHSKTFVDMRGRFERTFAIVFAMTFGSAEMAFAASRRLHTVHERIRGTIRGVGSRQSRFRAGAPYAANDRASLRWVYATLVDSVFAVREWLGTPLSPAIAERYYRETHRFARLFGLEPSDLPPSHRAFRNWMQRACEPGPAGEVSVSRDAVEMADRLLTPPHRLLGPVATRFRHATAALLPPTVRGDFGLTERPSDHAIARRAARACVRALRASPEPIRFVPGYLDAVARVGLRSRFDRRVDRWVVAALPFWPRGTHPA